MSPRMPIFDEPMTEAEREWLAEYEAIEADVIAAAERPLPGPLVVKLTVQRMGYRLPGAPTRKET